MTTIIVSALALPKHSAKKFESAIDARFISTGAGYRIIFPGTDLLPATDPDLKLGPVSRTKLSLAPGVEVSLVAGSPHPWLVVGGKAGKGQKIDFSQYLTDDKFWRRTAKQANDLKYLINRGNASADSYQFFGLAKTHGHVYLGVVWYSPADSFNPRRLGLVLRLDWDGTQVAPAPVRQVLSGDGVPTYLSYASNSWPPLLDTGPEGDLVLMENDSLWKLEAGGSWIRLPLPLSLNNATSAPPATLGQWEQVWLRGRWLVAKKITQTKLPAKSYNADRERNDFTLVVVDLSTGKTVRAYRWTDRGG